MHQLAIQQSLQSCFRLQKLLVAICHVVVQLGQGNNSTFMSFTKLYMVIIFADITLIMHGLVCRLRQALCTHGPHTAFSKVLADTGVV